jgi:CRP-like cAMP-binding protein
MDLDPQSATAQTLRELSRRYQPQGAGAEPSAQALEELARLAPTVTFHSGEVVFREGEPADRALFVVQGRLRATLKAGEGPDAQERPIGEVAPGDVVGEAAIFLTAGRRSATITALEPTICLELSRELFRTSAHNPALIALEVHLLHLVAQRIVDTDALLVRTWREPSSQAPHDRLALLLGGHP